MKHIVIYQENSSPIAIEDDDSSNIEEFAKSLASLLESNNVSLLHTSQGSLVLRPNKITSVAVYEVDVKSTDVQKISEPEKTEESEDIISD